MKAYPAWSPQAILALTPAQALIFLNPSYCAREAGQADNSTTGGRSDSRFPGKRVVTVATMAEYRKMRGQ